MPIPLVARAGVLAEVDSALAAARAGRGTLLTVTGEPGIGKTRLAEAAAGRAAGFEVAWTWGPAAAGGAALRPWSRVLRILAGGHAAVARLIADSPFLAALTDPGRAGGGRDPEGARSQLSFDLAEVIAAAATKRPVLVVFDDAHQADTSSLRLLAELAPALRTMPAAVLVTARDGDQDWRGRWTYEPTLLRSGEVISLQPLAVSDVAAVVAGVTGARPGRTWSASSPNAARETRSWPRSSPGSWPGRAPDPRRLAPSCPTRCGRWRAPGSPGCPARLGTSCWPRRSWARASGATSWPGWLASNMASWPARWRPGVTPACSSWPSRVRTGSGTTWSATPSTTPSRWPPARTCTAGRATSWPRWLAGAATSTTPRSLTTWRGPEPPPPGRPPSTPAARGTGR